MILWSKHYSKMEFALKKKTQILFSLVGLYQYFTKHIWKALD